MSEWVSERANKWAQRKAPAKLVVWSKRMGQRCGRTSKWTSEWPSTYDPIQECFEPQCNTGNELFWYECRSNADAITRGIPSQRPSLWHQGGRNTAIERTQVMSNRHCLTYYPVMQFTVSVYLWTKKNDAIHSLYYLMHQYTVLWIMQFDFVIALPPKV